jgi:hypothetical protein
MNIDNKKILIGAGVVIVGYLLWKKSKSNVKEYSENCKAQLQRALEQENVKRPNFSNDFLERCQKDELNKKNQSNSSSNVSTIDVNTIPDIFVIKSDGYNTTYKSGFMAGGNKGLMYWKISSRTDGSDSMGSPTYITAKEFEDAYRKFKNQDLPKSSFLDSFIKDGGVIYN